MGVFRLIIDDPKLNFSSSHFIVEHDKCERLHGHNYQVKIEVEGPLNKDYMVMDFKDAKDRVMEVCDELDHHILIPGNSKALKITESDGQLEVRSAGKYYSFPLSDCTRLPINATTAEELSRYIFLELKKDLPQLRSVYVAESEGSSSQYSDD